MFEKCKTPSERLPLTPERSPRIPPLETTMFKRILVPTDGSKLGEESARAAVALAKSIDATVVGFFASPTYQMPIYGDLAYSTPVLLESEFNKLSKRTAKKYLGVLEKLARESGVKFEAHTLLRDEPAAAIIEAAGGKLCDLICMGSHGRSGLVQLFLGGITTKVLAKCDIPVLVHRKGKSKSRTKVRVARRVSDT